jgi:hypothetical protein
LKHRLSPFIFILTTVCLTASCSIFRSQICSNYYGIGYDQFDSNWNEQIIFEDQTSTVYSDSLRIKGYAFDLYCNRTVQGVTVYITNSPKRPYQILGVTDSLGRFDFSYNNAMPDDSLWFLGTLEGPLGFESMFLIDSILARKDSMPKPIR